MSAHGSSPSRAAIAPTLCSGVGSYSSSSPSGNRLANSASGMRSSVVDARLLSRTSARIASRTSRRRNRSTRSPSGRSASVSYTGEYLNGFMRDW